MKQKWLWLLIIAFILSLIFDKQIVLFADNLHFPFLDKLFLLIIALGSVSIACIALIIQAISKERKNLAKFIISALITGAVVFLIKVVFERLRPFQSLSLSTPEILKAEAFSKWDFSMPSAHSAFSFFAVPFFSKKLKIFWIIFAVLVALSRVYFGLHYLSDVIAGALIGYFASILILRFKRKKAGKNKRKSKK